MHRILRHLEASQFEAAPRVLGIDTKGREILSFIEGTVVWPDSPKLLDSTDALTEVASTIRTFHDTIAGLEVSDASWSDLASDPTGPFEILCHNDLGSWNLIRTGDGWVFIDWDLAAPGRRAWDLGLACLSFLPLFPERTPHPESMRERLEAFCRGYGTDQLPRDLIEVTLERARNEARLIHERGREGRAPHDRLLREGHGEVWQRTADHIAAHTEEWAMLVRSIVDADSQP